MSDYGPSDPEFLEREPKRSGASSEYFPNFGVKLATVGWLTLAALGVAALVLGWDFHHWAISVSVAGGGYVAAAMFFAFLSQRSPALPRYSRFGPGMITPDYALGGPPGDIDFRVRRLASLFLLTGLCLAAIGIALTFISA